MKKGSKIVRVILLVLLLSTLSGRVSAADWKKLDASLVFKQFAVKNVYTGSNAIITVVRIDPGRYRLKLLSVSEFGGENKTAAEWAEAHGCIGGINAGMYLTDYKSNVGYMKNGKHLNNARINKKYFSFAVFNPENDNDPYFRIYDSDVVDILKIIPRYRCVVQNLRLIKRPRLNRWGKQEKRWSEIALGEDTAGNILILFCKSPFSMYEFNNHLLHLPIDLVCAQHLEGGSEASIYLKGENDSLQINGSYTGGWTGGNGGETLLPLPNVIGIEKRK
jgi:hypothetical protein